MSFETIPRTRRCCIAASMLLLLVGLGFGTGAAAEVIVGEYVDRAIDVGSPYPAATGSEIKEPELTWSDTIRHEGATYIAPHFSYFHLPPGDMLVLRSPDSDQVWSYEGLGRAGLGLTEEGFFATHIRGEEIVLELYSVHPAGLLGAEASDRPYGFSVDYFGRGYNDQELAEMWAAGLGEIMNLAEPMDPQEAICGTDDSREAKCFQSSEASAYNESRAVARLLRNGNSHCTGWLIGCEGHVMTNEHCIGSQSELNSIDFEFMAEGASCSTDCRSSRACPGTIEASGGTMVALDSGLDYALVLPATSRNLSQTYGFMQLRQNGAVLGERIYIPQHPAGWGKRLAVESTHPADGGLAHVNSLTEPPCSGSGFNDVGYFADTRGGSSGSPVLGHGDDLVIALHHCANCENRGVPIQNIISDLGGNLPDCALGGSPPPPPPPCDNELYSASFESNAGGWTNDGSSTCSTGTFVRGTPSQQVNGGVTTQVGGAASGSGAWFTATNTAAGTDDVDGGTCDTRSPSVSAGAGEVTISFDYFHGQRDAGDDAGDGFVVDVLNNGSVIATVVDFGDVTNNAAWTSASTTVNLASAGNLQLRVRATDAAGAGDLVEGGIDNVQICGNDGGPPPGGCTVDDDFESGAAGWSNSGASTCTTGDYVLGNPTQQVNGGVTTQVGGSNSGVNSIFTATNTAAGTDDVDGGNCILTSPSFSVGSASTLSVAYFHGQRDAGDDGAGDFFLLEYSTNGGSTFNTLVSNGDSTSNAAWNTATAQIPAGSNVQLRVQCSDGAGPGDLVECGIDDVSICDN